MKDDLIKCTSKNCIYRKTCARQIEEEPPSVNDEYYDYGLTCGFTNGWEDYVKYIYKEQ